MILRSSAIAWGKTYTLGPLLIRTRFFDPLGKLTKEED